MRSWFNTPLSGSLEADIYKATNIVRAFARIGNNAPERHIPSHILKDAAGFAVLSTVKVDSLWLSATRDLASSRSLRAELNIYFDYLGCLSLQRPAKLKRLLLRIALHFA